MVKKLSVKIDLLRIKRRSRGVPLPAPREIASRKDKTRQNARRDFRQKTRRDADTAH